MKLVTLRTKPIEDPGEWCYLADKRLKCEFYDNRIAYLECQLGHEPDETNAFKLRRPQSCIDSQEEANE